MKKTLIVTLVVVFSFLVFVKISNAAAAARASAKPFGGTIIDEEGAEIKALESAGFTCVVPGDTFDIKPVFGPVGPYIAIVPAKGGGAAAPSKKVLGLYGSVKSTIASCTKINPPPVPPITKTVEGYKITLWGVSKI